MEILTNYLPVFIAKCIRGIGANRERSEAYYISSPSLATALNPLIGYAAAAEIAKEAVKSGKTIPDLLREKKLLPEEKIREIFTPEFLAGQADRT
jgi:aspartate ammonia-lyase